MQGYTTAAFRNQITTLVERGKQSCQRDVRYHSEREVTAVKLSGVVSKLRAGMEEIGIT